MEQAETPFPQSAEIDEMLLPPSDAEAERALGRFAADVRRHYGNRIKGLYLFGSRARGDHSPNSDADVAVILDDGEWIAWEERWTLTGIAYKTSLDSGLLIQPWPISATQWRLHDSQKTGLTYSARRDAVPIGAAA